MFNDFPEQQAICAFFLDFVLLPRHPDSIEGHLEHLLPLYTTTSADSPLSLATSSVALMISGGSPTRRNDQQLGRTIFGKALRKTSAAIRNPEESRKDETLMAVLLLGLFEVRCFTFLAPVRNLVSWRSSRTLAMLFSFACTPSRHVSQGEILPDRKPRVLSKRRAVVGFNPISIGQDLGFRLCNWCILMLNPIQASQPPARILLHSIDYAACKIMQWQLHRVDPISMRDSGTCLVAFD